MEPLALETRAGNRIPNRPRLEQVAARRKAAVELILRSHISAKVRSATGVYNCFGMVFANRRTWVDNDDGTTVGVILRDDEYRRIAAQDVELGDVVIYRNDDEVTHVGIVSDVNPLSGGMTVLSQWGADGEYFHEIGDVHPSLGRPQEYWTERRPVP